MGREKRLGAKAAIVEGPVSKTPIMETAMAQTSSMRPTVPNGIRIGNSPNEEYKSHAEYAYGLVHTCSPSVVSRDSYTTIAAHLSNT
jgi:hypothetical protein